MDTEKKVKDLIDRVEKLEEENKELKEKLAEDSRSTHKSKSSSSEISRRDFLKKVGAGAAGIGALSLSPVASQLKLTKNGISSSSGLNFLDSGNEYFSMENSRFKLINADMDFNANTVYHSDVPNYSNTSTIRKNGGTLNERVARMAISDSNWHQTPLGESRGFALIHGKGSSQQFTDMVLWNYAGSPVVIAQSQHEGPPGRSYSTRGHDLQISFDSDPGEEIGISIYSIFTHAT